MSNAVYLILGTLLLAHIFVAATATITVLRDKSLEPFQVVGKILISWFGVYIGPLFVLYIMNEHSPELVPDYAQTGILHWTLFLPIRPPSQGDALFGGESEGYQSTDVSDIGIGGEGSCGAGGD